jgi:hypothetical protein
MPWAAMIAAGAASPPMASTARMLALILSSMSRKPH